MTLEQMKTEIIADLHHQLFRKPRHYNWTSIHWYYGSIYDTPKSTVTKAINDLVALGSVRKITVHLNDSNPFDALQLIPND